MAELTLIHSDPSPSALNVVFIHGLGGAARDTWMHKPKDHTTLWPRWVGEDARCNVWIAGYGAALSGWTEHAMHLADQGTGLMSALLYEPGLTDRPLVIVGHSLGGLVIKSGLVQAKTGGDTRFSPVLDALAGVVFIGTPHQGSGLATAAAAIRGLLRTNKQVVNMTADDAYLKQLNGQFRALQVEAGFVVSVFFETQGVFVGKRFLGIPLGKRIVVVDRNSSDPQIQGVTPTPIDADHIEIAKPRSRKSLIHRGMVNVLDDIEAGEGSAASKVHEASSKDSGPLLQRLANASAPLLNWPTTVPGGGWLSRPELTQLADTIASASTSLTLVLGEPGCGKSALLARLALLKQAEGWPVLAIKADRLPEEIRDGRGLADFLGIEPEVADTIRSIAKEMPVLVLVDQLDALADLVVQHSARLRVLLDLVHDLFDTPNVHVVASCRTFEQRHDPSLRTLEASVLTMALPEWDAVQELVKAAGVDPTSWNQELKEVLRSPHALDVFLRLLDGTAELEVLKSFQGMLQIQWESRVLVDRSGRRKQLMLDLARRMAEKEVLGLPLAAVEDWFHEVQELTAAGLLRLDAGTGRIEFRHQTLYEFVRARSFLDQVGSLADAVLATQSSLRIRPQLWHALAYLRTTSPESYGAEITGLWTASLRPHLKMLIIEFIGRQPLPLPVEVQLVLSSIGNDWFRPRFWSAAADSPGWFEQLAAGHLPIWMALPASESMGVVPILERALRFSPQVVVELVKKAWLPDSSKDELTWRVLGTGDVAPQTPEWVGHLETVALRTPLAEWTIGHVAGVISVSLPDQAPRIIAASLKRQLAVAKTKLAVEDDTPDPSTVPALSAGVDLSGILQARQLHELPAIAEAAPQAFVRALWPIYTEVLDLTARTENDFIVGFRTSAGMIADEFDDDDGRRDRPLMESMWKAIHNWAIAEPRAFLDFVATTSNSNLQVIERLIAKGVEQCASTYPNEVLQHLQRDARRLALGPYSDIHKESVAIIRTLAPHLDDRQFSDLELLLSEWKRYSKQPEGEDASTRQDRLRWSRHHRLRLLRALPLERCSENLRKLIVEEERAFPGMTDKDVHFSGVQVIGSPVTVDQMEKAKDRDILKIFDELGDESGWDHPRHRMKGGAIQAGRELASLAKKDLGKVLRIIRALQPARNEIPLGIVLRELGSSDLPPSDLFALVEELNDKGFDSEHFRGDAAHAVSSVVTAISPMPESLMKRMEGWLTPVSVQEQEALDPSENRIESVLWGHGRMSVVPDGNFPILSALTEACLRSEPAQVSRWLGILERHLERAESSTVWNAMSWRYFSKLRFGGRPRVEEFLLRLYRKYPRLIGETDCIVLVAGLHRWITVSGAQQLLDMIEVTGRNQQGLGELLLLRHSLFPAEIWTRERVSSALDATGEAGTLKRVGIAYAVSHLWHEPMLRSVVHPYLLQLARSAEKPVLNALSEVFVVGGFAPDVETGEFLDLLAIDRQLLSQSNAERLPEILEGLVVAEPTRVAGVANALLDTAGEQMGSIATSWYLGSEWLLAIALRLQDLGKAHSQAGSILFERMLEFNLPQAREMTLTLDKRTAAQASTRPPTRRRLKKK